MSFFPHQVFIEADDLFSKLKTSPWPPVQTSAPAQQAQLSAFVPTSYAAPAPISATESQSSTGTAASPSSSNTSIEQPLTPTCEQYLEVGDINKESCPCGWRRPRGRPTHDESQRAAKIAAAKKHGYVWPRPVSEEKLEQREISKKATKEKREKRRCEKEEENGGGKRQKRVNDQENIVSTPRQIQQPGETGQMPAWILTEEEMEQEITALRPWSPLEEDGVVEYQSAEYEEQAQWPGEAIRPDEEELLGQEEDGQFQWPKESEVDENSALAAVTLPQQLQDPGRVHTASAPELNNVWYALNYLDALKHHYNRASNPLLNPDLDLFYTTYEEGINGMVEYLNEQDPQLAPEPVSTRDPFMGFPFGSVDLDDSEL